MNVCTIVAKNYLAHARVLALSLREHHPGDELTVLVLDDTEGYVDPAAEPYRMLRPADIDCEPFERMVYDRAAHCWKQTWVDSEGSYLDFVGGFEDGAMELRRTAEFEGRPALFRMRCENIRPDSLDWSWQRSDDGGATWTGLWELEYTRVV